MRFLITSLFAFCVCIASGQFSDDFEDISRMPPWQIFHSGDPVYYQSLLYDEVLLQGESLEDTDGRLVMICGATYWYANVTGSYVYQLTWGDFTATTSVRAVDRENTSVPPDFEYNSAGLIVRNPSEALGQNYVMTNLGMQAYANGVGTESKTTINSGSTLYLDPDEHEGEVRIVRTGQWIRTFKRTAGDTDYVLLDAFYRPDLPDTLQIGMVLNGYTNSPDIRGEFDWIHFEGGDCRIVRNGADAGVSSLREAVACAQAGDTIRFDHIMLQDTIMLESGPLLIDKSLTLLNVQANPVEVAGDGLETLLQIAPDVHVEIRGIAFLGTADSDQQVILNQGDLTLVDCVIDAGVPTESAISNEGVLSVRGAIHVR